MRNFVQWCLVRWSTRRCRGCDDLSFHTHHLTRLGQWRYIDRWGKS